MQIKTSIPPRLGAFQFASKPDQFLFLKTHKWNATAARLRSRKDVPRIEDQLVTNTERALKFIEMLFLVENKMATERK